MSMGTYTTASGTSATAMGVGTNAGSFGEVTLGVNNVGGGSPTDWVGTDPLFEVGNGNSGAPSDALVVYKNGNMTANGSDNEMPSQTVVNANSVLTVGLADSRYSGGGGSNFSDDNELPNQVLFSPASVLTQGLADTRYVSTDGTDNEMPNQTLAGPNSVLTEGLANTLYTSAGGTDNEMPNQTIVNSSSVLTVALGDSRYLSSGVNTGTDNEMPNQQLLNSASILTRALADARYLCNGFVGSVALNGGSAGGTYSAAFGHQTGASSFAEFTAGQFNVGTYATGGDTAWISTDPLVEIGNGTDAAHPSDALLLDKSGNMTVKTVTVTAPGGDIPMYSGN